MRTLLAPIDGSSVLTGSSDTRLRCWRLGPGDAPRSFTVGGPPADAPAPMAYGELQLAVPGGVACRVLREYLRPMSANSAMAAAASSAGAHVGVAAGPSAGAEDRGCAAAVTSAVFYAGQGAANGLLLAGSLDGTVRVWK